MRQTRVETNVQDRGARQRRSGAFGALLLAALAAPALGQVTSRVSVATGGTASNNWSSDAVISADGRWAAFSSLATNLVVGDTNATSDVFLHDRQTGATTRVSVATGGVQANGQSLTPRISADGRYIAFGSFATNLVAGDTNGAFDAFVHDRQTGATTRASVGTGGSEANNVVGVNGVFSYALSGDGRYLAFWSLATNLVAGDTNNAGDVFVHDRTLNSTARVSLTAAGTQIALGAGRPAISADGRYVTFESSDTNIVAGDTNAQSDLFLRDRIANVTTRVSIATGGGQANSNASESALSSDGRFIVFSSLANNLVAGDTNAVTDIFVHDHLTGITTRESVGTGGVEANSPPGFPPGGNFTPAISADGRYVAFYSSAINLVPGDTNTFADVFVHDRQTGVTTRPSVSSGGAQANNASGMPWISADGRFVAFSSAATNLIAGDTNGQTDIFVHDRNASGFTSYCSPGVGGVIACPCANPPSGPDRGCGNSSATGGASISASGLASLSLDSLVFTTIGEKPTATSILLQGTASVPAGLVFGQGVRCVGGTLKRLFTKVALGGSISAPNLGGGDPTVSVRSAALGDTILGGQSRFYAVYYRDPTVLGGCPAASSYNVTQSGQVAWSP